MTNTHLNVVSLEKMTIRNKAIGHDSTNSSVIVIFFCFLNQNESCTLNFINFHHHTHFHKRLLFKLQIFKEDKLGLEYDDFLLSLVKCIDK